MRVSRPKFPISTCYGGSEGYEFRAICRTREDNPNVGTKKLIS